MLAPRWLGAGGPSLPWGAEALWRSHCCPCMWGLFGKWSWWAVPSVPGTLFNSGVLIAHTSGLTRKGELLNFTCSCELPNFKGSCNDKMFSVSWWRNLRSVLSFICWDSVTALKKSWHLKQIWSWYSLISSPIAQASSLPAGRSLAFEQDWNPDALRSRALRGFGLQWPPHRKPHDYASIKKDGLCLGLLL